MAAARVARVAAPAAQVRIHAPAKINLGLEVLGRRPDGYHELRTIFQAVSISDRLLLRRGHTGIRVRCPALPALGPDNLAHRAAELFFARSGVDGGVAIDLEKRIPVAGGLGGGSSDAAAVLLGCCRLFGVDPGEERLRAWAAELGSDVPFFIAGGAALGTGRGEIIRELPPWRAPGEVLIQIPPAGLSTAEVFRRLDAPRLTGGRRAFTILLALWREQDPRRFGAALFNDLEGPAFSLAPHLVGVKAALLESGACGAQLCGSGSSVAGLFESAAAADGARRRLRGRFPGSMMRARFLPQRRRWGVVKR